MKSLDIKKEFLENYGKYIIYLVDPFQVRNISHDLEEFGDYGFHRWFNQIPKNEIWISKNLSLRERKFILENVLTQVKLLDKGVSEHKAYINAERKEKNLRQIIDKIKFNKQTNPPSELYISIYTHLKDKNRLLNVFLINIELARDLYKIDLVEGGNSMAYKFIPADEIWLSKDLDKGELKFILLHEFTEYCLMKYKKLNYNKAHKCASKVEFRSRQTNKFPEFTVDGVLENAKQIL